MKNGFYEYFSISKLVIKSFSWSFDRIHIQRTTAKKYCIHIQRFIFIILSPDIQEKSTFPGSSIWNGGKKKKPVQNHCKNKIPVFENAISVLGKKTKQGRYLFWLFFKIGLCSAILLLKRSRREFSINVPENRSMLKNYQNTHYSSFSFIPKTGIAFPITGVLFLL